MSQRRCLKCRAVYTGEERFCAKDGSPLVDVAVTKAPAPAASTQVRKAVAAARPVGVDPAKTLRAQVLDGRYQVVRKLGEGGMSFVYEAKEIGTGTSVAVKIMTPKLAQDRNAAERLRREAGLAMRLEHPNICRILRLGETEEGLIYLVMPMLRGELLADREIREGPLPLEVGLPIMAQVCAGLQYAHDLHIIHRDLKPENIFLVKEEGSPARAVVMDFGLAKERRAEPGIAKLTATGIILGTPDFMSPEQIRGQPLDARSDIYALGLVAYEMFSGKLPFEGKTAQELMIARLRGQPLPLRRARADLEFSPKFEKALMKTLETDPAARYQRVSDFAAALEEAVGGGGMLEKLKGKFS